MSLLKILLGILILLPFFGLSQEVKYDQSIHHSFIENKGQWPDPVLFQTKLDGGNLWVQQHKFVYHLQDYEVLHKAHRGELAKKGEQLRQRVIHANFVNSNEVNTVVKSEATSNYFNYLLGNEPKHWAYNVHGYHNVLLEDLWDGIHLKLIEQQKELKYEFHVQPNVSTEKIKIEYVGQTDIKIDRKGNLIVYSDLGQIIEEKPYAYQIINGSIREVECAFELKNNQVGFALGDYNKTVELIIDPILVFATYAGSVTDNFGMTATYGHDGTAFSGGTVYGNAYPTPDPFAFDVTSNFTVADNPVYGITDVFLSHYSADGTNMLWTTFLGGGDGSDGSETVHSIIADLDNNIYMYGATSSPDFPMVGGYQTVHAGGDDSLDFYQNGVHFTDLGTDIYVAKISADGRNLLASTFIGGSGNDGVNYRNGMTYYSFGTYAIFSDYVGLTTNYGDQFRGEIFLDDANNCYVASTTKSTDFPVVSPFQSTNGGDQDGVIFKLSPNLDNLLWSSYFGGTNRDACYSVKIDNLGNVLCAGGTSSTNLPFTSGGYQPTYGGGSADGFLFKLDASAAMQQATYLGQSDYDQSFFVETDESNNIYTVGQTRGGTFPIINAPFANPGSGQYITKLTPDLTSILNSTTFGDGNPNFDISPSAFLVDTCSNIYVSGWGAHLLQSSDSLDNMPITDGAVYPTSPDGFDFYLFVMRRDFSEVLYATYFGEPSPIHEHVDGGTSRFDKQGIVYQSVCGACGPFAGGAVTTSGAWSETDLSSNCNNLLFKFDFELAPNAEFFPDQAEGCIPFEVTMNNLSTSADSYFWDFGNGQTSTEESPTVVYTEPGTYTVSLTIDNLICSFTDNEIFVVQAIDTVTLSTTGNYYGCDPEETTFIADANGSATSFVWSTNIGFTDTLNASVLDSTLTITPPGSGVYYVAASNGYCDKIDSVVVEYVSSAIEIIGDSTFCLDDTNLFVVENLNPLIDFDFVWTPDTIITNIISEDSIEVHINANQYLYVSATTADGSCSFIDSIYLSVGVLTDGMVEASVSDNVVPEGTSVDLSASPDGFSYSWQPSDGVSNPLAQYTSALVEHTTLYTVSVSDGICTKSDTVWVTAYPYVCEEPFVYVPNAFSPNGDLENDILYVYSDIGEKMVFRIFDRWGEMVFESFERSKGWDGTFRGKALDPDVYDYYLQMDCINGEQWITKGNIQLIK